MYNATDTQQITFLASLQVPFPFNSGNPKLELLLISSLPIHVFVRLFMQTIAIDRLIVVTIAANEVNKHVRLTVNLQLPRSLAVERTKLLLRCERNITKLIKYAKET